MKTIILPSPEHVYAAALRMDDKDGDLYGEACRVAGIPVPAYGPPDEWGAQSAEHALLAGALSHVDALAAVERIRVGEATYEDRGRAMRLIFAERFSRAVRVAAERGHPKTVRLLLAAAEVADPFNVAE